MPPFWPLMAGCKFLVLDLAIVCVHADMRCPSLSFLSHCPFKEDTDHVALGTTSIPLWFLLDYTTCIHVKYSLHFWQLELQNMDLEVIMSVRTHLVGCRLSQCINSSCWCWKLGCPQRRRIDEACLYCCSFSLLHSPVPIFTHPLF